ncbi:hypothetical protein N0V93_008927 [Gnomoniopsis smithogilvyi]|uniref:Uncharacterized protein n=1 Tax=Gnomoniopsis smithogilvyi TaxID=1191159 RepID=A0A9W9CS83_9PEZI|nr:hypothetical protein N0V93_008927 [Gnomoniopsis smithogilvyi]
MSGNSSAGNAAVYEAGDQRNAPDAEKPENQAERFEEGKQNSHQENDSKDERSIANRLAAAHDQNDPADGSGKVKSAETIAGEHDPTLPARMHGNEPSRGAKVDKKIDDEEAEIIRRMDESKAAKKGH